MKILVTNHWLKKLGGSETFTYAMVAELKRLGHEVDVLTFQPGLVSDRIQDDFGVPILSEVKSTYELILANHHTCVRAAFNHGPIIQTCHGTVPKLEQPSAFADAYVAISEEVKLHLSKIDKEYQASVILNGIDCNRFKPVKPINKSVKRVLSLAHDDMFNLDLLYHFEKLGIQFFSLNKFKNPVWNVEDQINEADLVISLGRGAYESMACGRPVLVMDKRPYQGAMADGLVNSLNVDELIKTNLSGRACRMTNFKLVIDSAIASYNRSLGNWCRTYALENLNIKNQIQQYLELWKRLSM
ncbi:glycosyltransferase [Sunxiuqinia sp. sy24]|uniref:glycosyltransferase n=1 Tax=Sunxiuqinia sp. sy24 TaxID=3461495 RepID=UPI004045988E